MTENDPTHKPILLTISNAQNRILRRTKVQRYESLNEASHFYGDCGRVLDMRENCQNDPNTEPSQYPSHKISFFALHKLTEKKQRSQ